MKRLLEKARELQPLRTGVEGMDRWLLLAVGSLLVIGMIAIYSATITNGGVSSYLLRHCFHVSVGLLLAIGVWMFLPLRLLRDRALPLALIAIFTLLLVHVPVLGATSKGAARWLDLGFMRIQPVEYTKLIILVYVCTYCARQREVLGTFKGIVPPLSVVFLADVCVLFQRDLGSAAIITLLALAALFLAGTSLRFLLLIAALPIVALVPLIKFFPHRMSRMVFVDPFQDAYGAGYQQTHSLMAFGKGGWLGDGIGQSVEKWSHLPEAHTDFILSVLAEETGILGVAIVLGLYAFILSRSFAIADEAERQGKFFANLMARVIGLMLVLQMTINIAGNLSLAPVKGLTLPLISYGGSSLVTWLVALALLQVLAHDNAIEPSASTSTDGGLKTT